MDEPTKLTRRKFAGLSTAALAAAGILPTANAQQNGTQQTKSPREMFRSDHYEDISLAEWIAHTPHLLVDQHLGVGQAMLDAIPKDKEVIRPR